jgi:hypothetical protein
MRLNHLFSYYQVFKHQLNQYHTSYCAAVVLYYLFFGMLPLTAQPSGGPYGPIQQTYEIPDVTGKIYYVAPDGIAETTGESLAKPTTIEAAIKRVKSGDAIVMRHGIYRTGNLEFNQGIIIQPYKDEKPVLKGTYVAPEWEQQQNGLWVLIMIWSS